jgi:hypothetical protein
MTNQASDTVSSTAEDVLARIAEFDKAMEDKLAAAPATTGTLESLGKSLIARIGLLDTKLNTVFSAIELCQLRIGSEIAAAKRELLKDIARQGEEAPAPQAIASGQAPRSRRSTRVRAPGQRGGGLHKRR